MPGRNKAERTYTVARVLSSGRVELEGLTGEHTESEFEQVSISSIDMHLDRDDED
jgi:hypothetical protein